MDSILWMEEILHHMLHGLSPYNPILTVFHSYLTQKFAHNPLTNNYRYNNPLTIYHNHPLTIPLFANWCRMSSTEAGGTRQQRPRCPQRWCVSGWGWPRIKQNDHDSHKYIGVILLYDIIWVFLWLQFRWHGECVMIREQSEQFVDSMVLWLLMVIGWWLFLLPPPAF